MGMHGRRRRRWSSVGVAVGIAAAMTTGCAAGGSAAGSGNGACNSPGVTPDQVTIGLVYPDSGLVSPAFQTARSAVEARVGLANATGGINGRRIVIDWRDDAATPTVNSTVVHDLIDNAHVYGLIELSTAVQGAAQYLDDQHIPVTGLTAETLWSDHNNMFSFSYIFTKGASVTTFGDYVKAQGGTKVAILADFGTSTATDITAQLLASLTSQGINVVDRVQFTAGQSDVGRAAAEITASHADVILSTVTADRLAEVYSAAKRAGAPLKLALSPTGYNPALVKTYGPALAGMSMFLNYTPFEADSPAVGVYRNAMAQYAPELASSDQEVAVASYITADLFLRGLKEAGDCPTRQSFITNLRKVTNYDAGGLVPGTVNLATNRGKLSECYSFVRVNDTGTGFDVVKNPQGDPQWCGTRLDG
jgi:ABC-type branched-subunit amino acid transport system substrate-binding protein